MRQVDADPDVDDLSGLYNPSLREKLERCIVSSIMNAKENLGLVFKKPRKKPIKPP